MMPLQKIPKFLLSLLPVLLVMNACTNSGTKKETLSFEQGIDNERKLNIILFFVDDLGWADLGYQDSTYYTPNIDKLKTESTYFSNCRITTPTCSPSRGTLLTGRHAVDLELVRHIPNYPEGEKYNYWKKDPAQMPSINWLKPGQVTYAERLAQLGYFNKFIGKWHLGEEEQYMPGQQGFDDTFSATPYGAPAHYYPPHFQEQRTKGMDTTGMYLTDSLTSHAVKFIQNYDQQKPFMLSMWYYNVHSPHHGRTDWLDYYLKRGLKGKKANYAAQVSTMDESVGKILQSLKDKEIEEETIILFLSDQGGAFGNGPLKGGKYDNTLCEGGTRVPLLIKHPDLEKPFENSTPVTSADIFPTLLQWADGEAAPSDSLYGTSIHALSLSEDATLPTRTFISYRSYEDQYASVYDGRHKLITYRSGAQELFDLLEDIGEQNNLAESKPNVINKLSRKLQEWEKERDIRKYSEIENTK